MTPSRRDLTRLAALGSAAVTIGIPIALVAKTWIPLETSRHDTETTPGEPESDLDERPGNRDRNQNNRQREPKSKTSRKGSAKSGTPVPEP
jgi:hypothetical protein